MPHYQRPKRTLRSYTNSSVSIPTGEKIAIVIDNNEYRLLHDREVLVESGAEFTSTSIVKETLNSNTSVKIVSAELLDVVGLINVSLFSKDKKIIATKNITKPTKVIKFGCGEILNEITLDSDYLLITFRSVCQISKEDCCDKLEELTIFDKIEDFCIYDPCANVMPLQAQLTTDRNTSVRFLLYHEEILLDTGYVNTTDDVMNYVLTIDDKIYFKNPTGELYLLDYYPQHICSVDDDIVVTNRLCKSQGVSYDCRSSIPDCPPQIPALPPFTMCGVTTTVDKSCTWVFNFDVCEMKVCVLE
jgi:hypothetical protein